MPRDKRLYMTFPIDFDEHPKVEPLSDSAFRAFVAMNGYSRRQGLDGRIPASVARKRWKVRALDELVGSHPDRPLVLLDGDVYVIRDYAEHQLTTDAIEKERETNRANGLKGGRPAKANRQETGSVSGSKADQNQSQESESESELNSLTDTTTVPRSSPVPNVRAKGLDPLQELIHKKEELATERASILGIRNPTAAHTRLQTALRARITLLTAIDLAAVILDKAKGNVIDPDAYLARACQKPDEIRQHFANLDAEALV